MAPPGGAGRGWCSRCRGGAQSVAVTSAMAARAEAWSTRFFPAPAVAIRAAGETLLTLLGLARAAVGMLAAAASVNRAWVRPAPAPRPPDAAGMPFGGATVPSEST